MSLFIYSFVILLLKIGVNQAVKNNPGKKYNSPMLQEILKDYDKYANPLSNASVLPVSFMMMVREWEMDHNSESYTINGRFIMKWTDSRLKWDTGKYNLTGIGVKIEHVWTPTPVVVSDFKSIYVKLNFITPSSVHKEYVYVTNTGKVHASYYFKLHITTGCTSDFRKWPHDSKECKIHIAFPSNFHQNITFNSIMFKSNWYLQVSKNGYVSFHNYKMAKYTPSIQNIWDFTEVTTNKLMKNESSINEEELIVNFSIIRKGSILSHNFLAPNVVFLCIILALFWIKPESYERLALTGLLLTLECDILVTMLENVPLHYNQPPEIIKITAVLFLLTIGLTVLTILFRKMLSTECNPVWLSFITTASIRNPIISNIFFLSINPKTAAELIEEDEEGSLLIMKSKKIQKQWQLTTHLFNSLIFLVYIPISLYFSFEYIKLM